jgi:hypothetical protein
VARLGFIRSARHLGFTFNEIGQITARADAIWSRKPATSRWSARWRRPDILPPIARWARFKSGWYQRLDLTDRENGGARPSA